MNGREFFNKYKAVVFILCKIISLLPNFIIIFLFEFIAIFPTKAIVFFRYLLLKSLKLEIGDNVYIGRYVTIKNIFNLKIGNNVSIHDYCYIDAIGSIVIEDNVSIAHSSSLISFEHDYSDKDTPIKYNKLKLIPIVIEHDVWIGSGVRILAGTVINNRTIIAAGAVVKGNIKGHAVFAGIPAKFIKDI
ncbi:hypothetical protein ABT56_17245 [Photobacterium aquae]|uniref:Acetyltransferase n=1 Tax=Photobacterium aquae TaxID=1195763 RepID=A0A0J1JP33_9GAMM|nr:acyltransferase [Photobacterium aquae]KLV03972.1 hypothetical protein ABT56_17245 [Photobacterium aquae]